MLDHGNGQLSAVGFFNPGLGEAPVGDFFGGAPGESHPQPYEVQWDGSLDGWKIYLPTGHLLSFDGEDVGTSSFIGVSPVPGSDDQAWKSLGEVGKNAGHAYLVLRVNKGTRAVEEARILPSAGSGSDSEEVYSFCIAELSYSSQLGFGEVRQSLVGALHVRGGCIPPDDISTEYYDGGSGQDGGSGSESETEKVLAVKGWHSMAATSGVTLVTEMGLVQQAREGGEGDGESGGSAGGSAGGSGSSRQVVVRNGVKGAIEYLDLGWFDVNGFVNSKIGNGVLSITVGNNSPVTFTANQATNASVTIPEGVALTDTDPSDVVLSTGTASAGVSTEAARADHVHKLPSTVKIKQSPVADPSASGTATAFIDSITQNANGEITVTKKNVDIPAAQVQSDWSVTDNTSKAFIKNKPTIPAIPTSGSLTVVTDVRYDTTSHQLQKKTRTITFTATGFTLGNESDWTMITGGQAVAHSGVTTGLERVAEFRFPGPPAAPAGALGTA